MATICITGGCGFIGSALVRHVFATTDLNIVNIDAMTYAANPSNVGDAQNSSRYTLVQADIKDGTAMREILRTHKPMGIIHLAAESHVDRSIDGPADFVATNVLGTCVLLEAGRDYAATLPEAERAAFRFHHVSTDEVFGALGPKDAPFTETTPYAPRSPYSASKAASDMLVNAWHHTYGLNIVLSNCSNNYGPYQYPEKLIPITIIRALKGEPIQIYGKGENIRDWLHVADHAEALWQVFTKGKTGEHYAIGGGHECSNMNLAQQLCALLDELVPRANGAPYGDLITLVKDRAGHDFRYAIEATKIERELGWKPKHTFENGLRETVQWYLENQDWWAPVVARATQRIGNG